MNKITNIKEGKSKKIKKKHIIYLIFFVILIYIIYSMYLLLKSPNEIVNVDNDYDRDIAKEFLQILETAEFNQKEDTAYKLESDSKVDAINDAIASLKELNAE